MFINATCCLVFDLSFVISSGHVLNSLLVLIADYSQNHERLTLGELLNNVDMGEFILSTVETKQQELEAVCRNLTTEQQGINYKLLCRIKMRLDSLIFV